jgi:ABC-type lipoprotein release transport system permease subunit
VEGGEVPDVLTGRLPQADDEVALGTRVIRRLHLHIGDTLHAAGPSGDPVDLSVVGTAVIPSIEESDSYGNGALVDANGLRRIDPTDGMSSLGVFLTKDHTDADLQRVASEIGIDLSQAFQTPTVVTNLARVRDVPYVIAAVVGGMAVISLVQLVVTAVRRRRRDLAVLGALGATRPWLHRVVQWQASLIAAVAAVLAIPIGIAIGRTVYRTFPDRLGARFVPDVPVWWLALLAVAAVVLANAVAWATGAGSPRLMSRELRSE